jgi:hypothetical protein
MVAQAGVGEGEEELGINAPVTDGEILPAHMQSELIQGCDKGFDLLWRIWHEKDGCTCGI